MKKLEVFNKENGLEEDVIHLEMNAFDDLVSVARVA